MNVIFGALKSKTVWAGVIAIVAGALIPGVQDWIAAHPGGSADAAGLALIVLRALTTESLAEKGGGPPPDAK